MRIKISWKKYSKAVLVGYVNKVRCFEISKEGGRFVLINELPSDDNTLHGRRITSYDDPKKAAVAASKQLRTWCKAFFGKE